MINLFVGYEEADAKYLKRLETFLRPFERNYSLAIWHTGRMTVGDNETEAIERELNEAQIIILLVSQSFLSSDFYFEHVHAIEERVGAQQAKVLPILIRSCNWGEEWFSQYLVLPAKDQYIAAFPDHEVDTVFTKIGAFMRGYIKDTEEELMELSKKEPLPMTSLDDLLDENRKGGAAPESEVLIEEIGENTEDDMPTLEELNIKTKIPNRNITSIDEGNRKDDDDAPTKQAGKRRDHLLLIGIDKYRAYRKLHNCIKDCEDVSTLLIDKFGFEKRNVTKLYNEDATELNLLNTLEKYVQKLTEDDNLLIYYSGHGIYNKVLDAGYWIPVDAKHKGGWLNNSHLVDHFRQLKVHHLGLVIDACFSGSMFALREAGLPKSIEKLNDLPSRWCLSAGLLEPVSDGVAGDNSPFTKEVLYFLNKSRSEFLAFEELGDSVKEAVQFNADQIPRCEPLQGLGHKGGQFIFKLKED